MNGWKTAGYYISGCLCIVFWGMGFVQFQSLHDFSWWTYLFVLPCAWVFGYLGNLAIQGYWHEQGKNV